LYTRKDDAKKQGTSARWSEPSGDWVTIQFDSRKDFIFLIAPRFRLEQVQSMHTAFGAQSCSIHCQYQYSPPLLIFCIGQKMFQVSSNFIVLIVLKSASWELGLICIIQYLINGDK
jgi:hypothetical protein